jgi:NADH:ubiquinone oxidoreductase subunit 6 (subunit J)
MAAASAVWAFIAPILAVALPILAVVGAIALLILYAEELYDFFDAIPQWLEEKLGFVGKILGVIFQVLAAPLQGLFWLIKTVKKFGLANTFAIIWNNIKNLGKYLMEALTNAFWSAINAIKNIGANAWESVKGFGGNAATRVMNALGSFADWIYDKFLVSLKSIGAFFQTLASNPQIFFGLGGKGSLGKAIKINVMKTMAEEQIASGLIRKSDYMNDKTIMGQIVRGEDISDEDINKSTDEILIRLLNFFQDQAKKGQSSAINVNNKIDPSNADTQKRAQ